MQSKLDGLTGNVRVIAKFANRDNAAGDGPEWGTEQAVTLSIDRRTPAQALRKPRRPGEYVGDIITMNVREFNWAEYGQDDHCGNDEWLCEEYRMQIIDVVPRTLETIHQGGTDGAN